MRPGLTLVWSLCLRDLGALSDKAWIDEDRG